MRPSPFGTILAAVVLAAVSFVAARPVGPIPALGPLLDPVRGIWRTSATVNLPVQASVPLAGLARDTRVLYDDRGVPHIFAASTRDAYRALGYVVARDRLFQIELQGRAGAGTLTALVGPRALPLDRETRASGMPRAAERRAAALDSTGENWLRMQAYVDGVNTYVDALAPADDPIEYKLLGRRPRRMQVIDVLHLFNRMGATLASSRDELDHLAASARVGRAAADALFPVHAPIVEPIQPNGAVVTRIDPVAIPAPGTPDTSALAMLRARAGTTTPGTTPPGMAPPGMAPLGTGVDLLASATPRRDDAVGSNNWAVAPTRSASGAALLAGDPHLELTLPSIWYEAHLVVGDSIDVYGVTIPGLPGIIIGFSRAVAWTFTNTGADVMDFYAEAVDDAADPRRYLLDGTWRTLEQRPETYTDAAGRILGRDTLRFTHRGPLRRVGNRWVSVRWTVLEATRDAEAFDAALHATSADALLAAMGQYYRAPAQNMLVADTSGTIAIRSTGRFPIRPGDGRGDRLRDGRSSSSDWLGDWSTLEAPQAFRPAQGFLASANQEPLDPRVQPRYLGANWERPWRAIRINTLLRADSSVTPDAMRRYQTDPGSARADFFVPVFAEATRALTAAGRGDQRAERAARLLAAWDRRYTIDNRGAVLFEEAMRQLSRRLWDELRGDSLASAPIPTDMMTAALLGDSASIWWDDRATPSVETRNVLLSESLAAALDTSIARHGDPAGDGWRWRNVRKANVGHLLRLPAFSRADIPVQGGSATLWPSSGDGRHGPSWRMVVELGKPRRAWAIYPGGQSGNPLSVRYDDRMSKWARGELDTLRLPGRADELPPALRSAELLLRAAPGVAAPRGLAR